MASHKPVPSEEIDHLSTYFLAQNVVTAFYTTDGKPDKKILMVRYLHIVHKGLFYYTLHHRTYSIMEGLSTPHILMSGRAIHLL